MRRTPLAIAITLGVLSVAVCTWGGFRVLKSLLGYTCRGEVAQMGDIPLFAKELHSLQTDGRIAYHIYRQWGRHIAFVSGKTSWHDLTNFVSSTGMELHLRGEMDTDLNHMALACGIDQQKIVTAFSEQDAFAKTVRSPLGKYVYVRYRYADQKFTMLFFN